MNSAAARRPMNGAKRIPTWAVVIVVLVVVALLTIGGVHLWLDAVIKQAIEQVGSKMTRSTVTVEDVDTSLIMRRVQINGLVVANPQGFRKPTAMKADKTTVRFDWTTIFSDPIVIEEITVDEPAFTYEGKLGRNNLTAIREKIETLTYTGPKDKGAPLQEPRTIAQKVLVREFSLTNGHVTWQGKDGSMTATLPDIRLNNIAEKSGGAGIQEIASAIYHDVTRTVMGTDKATEKDQNAAE